MNCRHCEKPLATVFIPPNTPICRCDGNALLAKEALDQAGDSPFPCSEAFSETGAETWNDYAGRP